jgi:iron complex outermembrane receptor protein
MGWTNGHRFLFIGAISYASFPGDCALAQVAPSDSAGLAGHRGSCAGDISQTGPRQSRTATAARNVRRVYVYPTAPTPMAGSGMDVDKVPAAVNARWCRADRAHGSLNIADALQQQVPGSSQ